MTKDVPWNPEVGVIMLIGFDRPSYVFARAEPHRVSLKIDRRVAVWTTRQDPTVVTTGFAAVYQPGSTLALAYIPTYQLKPYRRKSPRWP